MGPQIHFNARAAAAPGGFESGPKAYYFERKLFKVSAGNRANEGTCFSHLFLVADSDVHLFLCVFSWGAVFNGPTESQPPPPFYEPSAKWTAQVGGSGHREKNFFGVLLLFLCCVFRGFTLQ